MELFDIIHTPLTGTNLIEASAGTGKTYTIAGLYTRMIIEKGLTVDQILVVTFTKAATEELKGRIRSRLAQTLQVFRGGTSRDKFVTALYQKIGPSLRGRRALQNSLINFDRGAIYTIHGFCQRLLYEYAFETGLFFDTELVTDPGRLTREVAEDFWRRHFYDAPPEFIAYALDRIKSPRFFYDLLASLHSPGAHIIPQISKPELTHLDPYRRALETLRRAWPKARDAVRTRLCDEALSGRPYGTLKPDPQNPGRTLREMKVDALLDAMDALADPQHVGFPLFEKFDHFSTSRIEAATRKNKAAPSHPFFDLCEELFNLGARLSAEFSTCLTFLKTDLFSYARKEFPARKQQRNIQFFDDLLSAVQQALAGPGGGPLARLIRKKYRTALVDEFQDTDTIQWEILGRLFGEGSLFLIGDPKQAIYGFRGGDIFSYLQAVDQVEGRYTLKENWRSAPGLITAVNTLFSNRRHPFLFEGIRFEKGTPGPKKPAASGLSAPPLILWHLAYQDEKPVNKGEAIETIVAAVGNEVAQLLSSDEAVQPGDIAILVRTNRQAMLVKEHLFGRRIPAVVYHTGNVFESREAGMLERLLAAICEPSDERLLRRALTSDLIGVRGEEMHAAADDPLWWESKMADFKAYARLWEESGFIRMWQRFMTRHKVRVRLLALADGERRLTNLLHLAELLHQQATGENSGMKRLLRWLQEQILDPAAHPEEHQLRLESDDLAVKIVTIHKSKGLQYRIVFCPFAWEGVDLRSKDVLFHDETAGMQIVLDLGSEQLDSHTHAARKELLAENLRLLYVALTRAVARCYVVCGKIKGADTSALSYLLHYEGDGEGDIMSDLRSTLLAKKPRELAADLEQLVQKSAGVIQIRPILSEPAPGLEREKMVTTELAARRFSGRIDQTWKITSYSALTRDTATQAEPEAADYDPLQTGPVQTDLAETTVDAGIEKSTTDIIAFPRGRQAGTFFHDIWEHIDYQGGKAERSEIVRETLSRFGFDPGWLGPVCDSLEKTLCLALLADQPGLMLGALDRADRINEMGFYFPLYPIRPRDLADIFKSDFPPGISKEFSQRLGRLTFAPAEGFLKGYIDLIFRFEGRYYLVDWKSNFLGLQIEDYSQDRLQKVMQDDYYVLQYHLYALAFCQQMHIREPAFDYTDHFGGIFYIFLRGIDPQAGPAYGIYYDTPSVSCINRLGKRLIPGFMEIKT